jgi:hypothetical protein
MRTPRQSGYPLAARAHPTRSQTQRSSSLLRSPRTSPARAWSSTAAPQPWGHSRFDKPRFALPSGREAGFVHAEAGRSASPSRYVARHAARTQAPAAASHAAEPLELTAPVRVGPRSARTSSGSSCSAPAVKPTRSAKRTVTTLRSSRAGAAAVSRGAPQELQKGAGGVVLQAARTNGHSEKRTGVGRNVLAAGTPCDVHLKLRRRVNSRGPGPLLASPPWSQSCTRGRR